MPLKYRLVKRKDMSKGAAEGTELYFAQTSITYLRPYQQIQHSQPR